MGRRLPSIRSVVPTIFLLGVVAACSGPSGPAASGGPTDATGEDTPAPASPGQARPGSWQGTVTFHAVLDTVKDETTTSGTGTYQETLTTHDITQADVTDVFSVDGSDPDDMSLGVSAVDLTGTVANQGTTLERYTFVSDKHNALGCHWTGETGTELKGSWSGTSQGPGSISFDDDGSYHMTFYVGGDPITGETPESPALPKRLWEANTILEGAAKDCPGPGFEQHTTEGPVVQWASTVMGAYDSIEGQLDPAVPGSVVDGSATFDITLPEATLTVTWHLVHDGPIVLPHD